MTLDSFEGIPTNSALEGVIEDSVLPIKVGSFFSKTMGGNGYEIVATLYAESFNQSEIFSKCVSSKGADPENDRIQFWDLNNYSNCGKDQQPHCLNGSFRILSAMSFNVKIGKLQRYFACILPSQKSATEFKSTTYKHFDSKLQKWTCLSASESANYWDLGGYSRCTSEKQIQCLQGTKPYVTSLVHMPDDITKYSVACVLSGQSTGTKVVASRTSGTFAGGVSNWCDSHAVTRGFEFDEFNYSLCNSNNIPVCSGNSKKILKAGVTNADGSVGYYSMCVVPGSSSKTNIVASMSGFSNLKSEKQCGNINWDLNNFVGCENGNFICKNGSHRVVQGQASLQGQIWTEYSCALNETISLRNASQDVLAINDGRTAIIYAHQDDDLLWMQPFWNYANNLTVAAYEVPPAYDPVIQSYPEYLRSIWNPAWGRTTDSRFGSFWLNACEREGTITLENIKEKIRPIVKNNLVNRIVTHNPWGEYGHLHHRLVSQAVRELAVEYGKDVWALSSKVDAAAAPGTIGNYANLGNLGLDFVDGEFVHSDLRRLRSAYQSHGLSVPIPGASQWTTWTWGSQEYDYPAGKQTFIKLVKQGVDQTTSNGNIQSLVEKISVFGKCLR